MEFTVQPYTADQEAAWDRFVMQESGNGTFLQTRNFLNYHPAGRFEDASLVVTNEHDAIVAVVPAAVQEYISDCTQDEPVRKPQKKSEAPR